MKIYKISKPIITTLWVECGSEVEAMNWADKIVATIEDENGVFISSNAIRYFEAEAIKSEVKILEITDEA
jgi:hypothetical protein